MSRNPYYDILFDRVKIGPVTAPNRFYQTPHALGTGHQMPHTEAAMREVRAEGGWGVVNTGYCSIHPSSDDSPLLPSRLWDEKDVREHALVVDAIHRHGSLAGIELYHGGSSCSNKSTRITPISVSGVSINSTYPSWISLTQSRSMDRNDIADMRSWYVDAARRAKSAGYDIVYIYAGMSFGPYQFLLPWLNRRTDEYGGNLENRVRLLREILEEMKAAIGDTCGIAIRFSSDDLLKVKSENMESEAHEVVSLLSDLPDLWDIKSSDWTVETASARFVEEGAQESWNSFAKSLTSKPVVGVGRFTSPDEMVRQIRGGILDFIGAARPSIADPFLPRKIDEGREDEIRECIGCNICVSCYHDSVPVRCTQNPTAGEEWRRNWHPERIPFGDPKKKILVIGAGPAGLECSRVLGQRGFSVTLAEKRKELGGRIIRESGLPGLGSWMRVRDYRTNLIKRMPNVDIYLDSLLSSGDINHSDYDQVVIATGSEWKTDILSQGGYPIPGFQNNRVYTPDQILSGATLEEPIVIYDFDHYYMGGCLAELLRERYSDITLVTPANAVSAWTSMNNESLRIRERMNELRIKIVLEHYLIGMEESYLHLTSIYRNSEEATIEAGGLIIVGVRSAKDTLYKELISRPEFNESSELSNIKSIGDCVAPGTIAHAIYSGHEYGRNIDEKTPGLRYKVERPSLRP